MTNISQPELDPVGSGSSFRISGPGPDTGGGGGLQKAEHLSHLLAFIAPTPETRTGGDGKAYEVALCIYALCQDCHTAWPEEPVSGVAMVPRLLSGEGEIVVGRLDQLDPKPGRTGAYVLGEPVSGDIEVVEQTLANFAGRLPSGRVIFDVDAYNNGSSR